MNIKDIIAMMYEIHSKRIYGIVHSVTRDRLMSEEIVHDTFIKAAENLYTLRDTQKMGSWLNKIALNLTYNVLREKNKTKSVSLTVLDLREFSHEEDPLKTLTAEEACAELRTALAQLDPLTNIVVTLFYFEEMSLNDIAAHLDIPVGTVKSRLSRAKIKLRKKLNQSDSEVINSGESV